MIQCRPRTELFLFQTVDYQHGEDIICVSLFLVIVMFLDFEF